MTTKNRIQTLNFASDFIEATVVHSVKNYDVDDAITVNLSPEPIIIGWEVPSVLPSWKSTILKSGHIKSGTCVGLFKVRQETNLGGVVFRGWEWLGNRISSFPRDTPLYISAQDSVGNVELDPFVFTNERTVDQGVDESDVADYPGLHLNCCLLTTKNRIKDENGIGANQESGSRAGVDR